MRYYFLLILVILFCSKTFAQGYKIIEGTNEECSYTLESKIDINGSTYLILGNYSFDKNGNGFPIDGTPMIGSRFLKIDKNGKIVSNEELKNILNSNSFPLSNVAFNQKSIYFSVCQQGYDFFNTDSNFMAWGFSQYLIQLDTNGNFIAKTQISSFKAGQPERTILELLNNTLVITTSTAKNVSITTYSPENKTTKQNILDKWMPAFNVNNLGNTFSISGFEEKNLKFTYLTLDSNFVITSEKIISDPVYNFKGTNLVSLQNGSHVIYSSHQLYNYNQNFSLLWKLTLDTTLEIKSIKQIPNGKIILTCQLIKDLNTEFYKIIINQSGKILSKEKLFSGNEMFLRNIYYGENYYISIIDTAIYFNQKGIAPKVIITKTLLESKETKQSDKDFIIFHQNKKITITSILHSPIGSFILLDATGKICYKSNSNNSEITFGVENFSNGIYFIIIGNYSKKILIN